MSKIETELKFKVNNFKDLPKATNTISIIQTYYDSEDDCIRRISNRILDDEIDWAKIKEVRLRQTTIETEQKSYLTLKSVTQNRMNL